MLKIVNCCCREMVWGFDCNLKINPCQCIFFFFAGWRKTLFWSMDIGGASHRIFVSKTLIIHQESNTILTQMPCQSRKSSAVQQTRQEYWDGGRQAPTAAVTTNQGIFTTDPSTFRGKFVTPTIPFQSGIPTAVTSSTEPAGTFQATKRTVRPRHQ